MLLCWKFCTALLTKDLSIPKGVQTIARWNFPKWCHTIWFWFEGQNLFDQNLLKTLCLESEKTRLTNRHLYYIYGFFKIILAFFFLSFIQVPTLRNKARTVTPYEFYYVWLKILKKWGMKCFNLEYVHMNHNILHNIQKVFDKYIFYLYMFDTEDSQGQHVTSPTHLFR